MNILSAPLHIFPWELFSSRTLSISISGHCKHSSMFHCSYIYKWSLVVCGSRYCTELSQNSSVHLLCSACESSAAPHVLYCTFIHGPCKVPCTYSLLLWVWVHFRHEYTYCAMNIVHLITVLDLGLFSITWMPIAQSCVGVHRSNTKITWVIAECNVQSGLKTLKRL